ncbi:hypothetical protein QJS10_CPB22g00321 [Acorus calamus]|uniref:Uncharacterized protein n=1 Tax=Acorus calamus TaxID=4465 RepID=A0AAV9BZ00_ACOCL|nr:hypothetical protein QJS10_CPB22g00321 [Acorus calamus]
MAYIAPTRKGDQVVVNVDEADYASALIKWSKALVGEEDLLAFLEGGPWTMANRPFVLHRWSPSSRMDQEQLTSIPI